MLSGCVVADFPLLFASKGAHPIFKDRDMGLTDLYIIFSVELDGS